MSLFTVNPILIAAAVIPAVILLVHVYKADKLDKEPRGLLISLVLLGILSTFIAIILEEIGLLALSSFLAEDTILYNLVLYFIVVGVSEEAAKYLLLKVRTWKSPHFNCQFDGVVYAVFVSLGFALWENIGYVIRSGLATALVRALTAVPGHACFGVFMGVFYGAAKRFDYYHKQEKCKRCLRLSLLFPIFMHGVYDFVATMDSLFSALIFIGFVAVMFIFAYRLVKSAAQDDRFITDQTQTMPNGYGTVSGYGTGTPNGYGTGTPNGYGNGMPNGYGSGTGPYTGYRTGSTNGYGTGSYTGYRTGSSGAAGSGFGTTSSGSFGPGADEQPNRTQKPFNPPIPFDADQNPS